MTTDLIRYNAAEIDLSQRFPVSTTVVASPSAAAETIVASLTVSADLDVATGVKLCGWAAFTVGTAGVSTLFRIRKTNVSGTVVVATGAIPGTAGSPYERSIRGLDTSPTLPGQVYVLTMTVASASAASTVSAVALEAVVV